MSIAVPSYVQMACSTLQSGGFQAYLVGGAIRDSLLGLKPSDWDIATDARPEAIESLFSRTRATGKTFGTITVILEDQSVEITAMRQDGPYSDGRRPDSVQFTDSLPLDLARRDFTINAIAYDPFSQRLIDPFSGTKHLRRKMLVTVGAATERFQEDPLRMLRLIRFAATLGFRIEKKTRLAIQARWIDKVSAERILNELNQMLLGRELRSSLEFFYTSGLMARIIPELAAGAGVCAGKSHPYDLLGHLISTAHFALPRLPIRWAALLHDLGKIKTVQREHAALSAAMAAEVLTRLRAGKELIASVRLLVGEHMFEIQPHSSAAAIRRFLARVGAEAAFDLVELRQADCAGMNGDPRAILAYSAALKERFSEILAADAALDLPSLMVDGRILMQELSLKPGPLLGQILSLLMEQVLEDPSLNRTELLLELARNHLESLPEIRKSNPDYD